LPGGLNRYGITVDNTVALVAAIWTAFTAMVVASVVIKKFTAGPAAPLTTVALAAGKKAF